jgi:hypothetical protein
MSRRPSRPPPAAPARVYPPGWAGTRRDVPARRARYRSARRAILAIGLLVGIGYPLALALGGALFVRLHNGPHGTSLSVHNARPWLIVAGVAAVLLVLDGLTPSPRRAPSPEPPGGPAPQPRSVSSPAERSLQARIDGLQAARRSEREFNAALDAHLAARWVSTAQVADRRELADAVLALSMELVEAPMGLLVLGHDARGAVAARGVDARDDLVAQLADEFARGRGPIWRAPTGEEWLVLDLAGEPGGYIALGGRAGGFGGLDGDALGGVARRAAALLGDPAGDPRFPAP